MSALSDDTLRKVCRSEQCYTDIMLKRNQILLQIQQTAIQSRRSLDLAAQQVQAKERERRILQLTIDEISQMPQDVNMYKGVGKAYVTPSSWSLPML